MILVSVLSSVSICVMQQIGRCRDSAYLHRAKVRRMKCMMSLPRIYWPFRDRPTNLTADELDSILKEIVAIGVTIGRESADGRKEPQS